MRSPSTNEIAAEWRCGEVACASHLHTCETAATIASIGRGQHTDEMRGSPRALPKEDLPLAADGELAWKSENAKVGTLLMGSCCLFLEKLVTTSSLLVKNAAC
jgi:hypothetical protein